MTSSSFDGEYIARIIELFGYRAVRGSSTRGGVRALLGMHTEIEEGRSVAFTIDGPLGPVYMTTFCWRAIPKCRSWRFTLRRSARGH